MRKPKVEEESFPQQLEQFFLQDQGFLRGFLQIESLKIIHFVICWWSNWKQIFDQKVYIDVPYQKEKWAVENCTKNSIKTATKESENNHPFYGDGENEYLL